jgi:signal transduction histidine kinase
LIRSLDDRSTLQEVADLAVPAIADWCFVNVLDDAGRVVETASAHRDTGRHHDGSATLVLHTQQPVLIEEVTDERRATDAVDDDQRAFLRAFAARSAILVPLISHGRAFGSVTFLTAESERRFDQDDLTLAVELARRAATAIENDRLYADLRRARERAESLARASDLLAQGTDRETPLALLAELAVVSFADWCFVNVPDPDGTLRCVVAAARTPEDRAVAERSLGRAVVDPAFSEGRTILWEQLTDADLAAFAAGDAGAPIDYLRELSPGSAIAVPVRGRGGILGSLSLIARTDRPGYGPADIDHAEQLAWRTALALENAALYEDLRRLATTEQARAGELAAVIQAVGDPMVVCDRDGRVRLANQAARVAFDGEIPATFGGIRARFDDPEQLDSLGELGAGERGGPVELRLRGTDRWLELTTYPVPATFGATEDGRALGSSILVLRDVTAIRRALELREAFIGVLSHELRTPITTIYGGTRVLAREGVSEDTRREIAADVTAEAERLHRLVEDLLVLARAERETMDLGGDPVLLQHLVPRVLRTEEQRWPETMFRLSLPASVTAVSGDETYVEQVVRNLVGNAAKYGGATGIVEVAVEPYEDEVVVRVLDEGPGFATTESERLFELFYRSAKTSATTSGAGIGLFVCRALVEAMGGRIWAHPRPAGGAEFGFALPVFSEDE